jgi:DNA helicase II / ATP-dependent DNA helicase PcrA
MTVKPTVISSDTILADVNRHFRVFAGPGAGKTYWLIKHLLNVLRSKENKLIASSKIACISYTTIASEIIRNKFHKKTISDKVEFSTIHSFLYTNILKPYAHFLKNEQGKYLINLAEMDGHDDHFVSFGKAKEWAKASSKTYLLIDTTALISCLETMHWDFNNGTPQLTVNRKKVAAYKFGPRKISFPQNELKYQDIYLEYKKLYWNEGVIHHDDVLYFSFKLLKDFPSLRAFLALRYPYIFIDEFQDTNPFQAQILLWLSENGITTGVIGDLAQSIYNFQGAKPELFRNFLIANHDDYVIENNRRSTNQIIKVLNSLRTDITQSPIRNVEGTQPIIYVGNTHLQNINKIKAVLPVGKTIVVLARKNSLVTQIKGDLPTRENIWEKMYSLDPGKAHFLESIIIAMTYAKSKRYDQAINEVMRRFKNKKGSLRSPLKGMYKSKLFYTGLSIELIQFFLSLSDADTAKTMSEIYNTNIYQFFKTNSIGLAQTKSGDAHNFLCNHTFQHFISSVKAREDSSTIRTIHNAKGDEFENVCVCLEDEKDLNLILKSDLAVETEDGEESRIRYVAISRAMDFLALSVLKLEDEEEKAFEDIGFSIIK